MNGDADLPQRSSSPLKRRASSMDPEANVDAAKPEADSHTEGQTDGSVDLLPNGFSRDMSVDAPDTSELSERARSTTPQQPPPPLMEQVKIIEMLLKAFQEAPVKDGDVAYLVSRSWVDKALALRSTDSKEPPPDASQVSALGPVDNSDIIQDVLHDPSGTEFVRLKPGADEELFELFPPDAWKLVMDWYGLFEGQRPISRTAINTSLDEFSEPNIMYEFHPPVFRVHRLWSEVSTLPIEQSLKARNPGPLVLARSRKYHCQTFLKELKEYTGVPLERKIRLWAVPSSLPTEAVSEPRSALTPPDSPRQGQGASRSDNEEWPHLLLDLTSFTKAPDSKQRLQIADQTANINYNGKATLQLRDLVTDQILVVDESVENEWVSTYSGRSKKSNKTLPSRATASGLSPRPNSNRSSPALEGPITRGRMQKKKLGRGVGAVGLHNLGNTCYMNSALQCVRSVEELTKYFLTDVYQNEINDTNLLGYEGRIARAYGGLLKEIYAEGRGSVSPRDFKLTVGRCRPTFSGWGQQDSQEFLGFLLDGLQEDLSRIKKKPYIEKPDSTDDMINDPDAIREMADKVWDITKRRDDSVIADLFTGMYKSTLKCPECGKISITFDPFNNLTLPLPLESMWTNEVKFYPLNDVPIKIDMELPKHSSIEQLKQYVSARTGVPVDRLMGAEEFKDRFFKIYDNSGDVTEDIPKNDVPAIHELEAVPTNWPAKGQPRKKIRSMLDIDAPLDAPDWEDPRYEVMVVPVLHRRPQTHGRSVDGVSPPHFITLTREEASSYDVIQRKVLERVATFSTWSKFSESSSTENEDGGDGDAIVANGSDADSSGDSKIAAQSIESEDDIVDVKMRDASQTATSGHGIPNGQPMLLKNFNRRRPRFVSPKTFLTPDLQNLFQLCYFTSEVDGPVPTGWSSVESSRSLPKLTDRIPASPVNDEDDASPESWNSTQSGDEESSNDDNDDAPIELEQTRMADESSEEDLPRRVNHRAGGHRANQKGGPGGRKKFKGHKAYGKKGNKRRDKVMRAKEQVQIPVVAPQPMPPAVADGGPLIRLHEGIVVDWNEDAWDMAFGQIGKNQDSAAQGSRTFTNLEVFQDPAVKINRRRRQNRQNRGITLDECLDEFERAEVLSEQDMWYCPRCKEHRRASKKFDLWKTPDYLVAHLKRFSSSGWRRDKVDVLVDFPIEGLDLTSRVIQQEDGKGEVYDLIAVDDHYGGLGGGHYTAYAKNFVDGRWYNYNDSSVNVVSDPATVVSSAAYLLFYRRRFKGHLGGHHFAEIFDKYSTETHNEDANSESGDEVKTNSRTLADKESASKGAAKSDSDGLPPYDELEDGETIHRSIENDNDSSDEYQRLRPGSLDMTQGWSFNGLDGNGTEGPAALGYGSDDAQIDSSDDERGRSVLEDQDTDMTSTGAEVVAVPAAADSTVDSDEVTEIHLEGERTA